MTQIARCDPVEDLLAIATDFRPVVSLPNPLAVKGAGEGSTAATPTVMNATLDALAPARRTDVPMPATPERVWRAIRQRSSKGSQSNRSSAPRADLRFD
jgi:aerobic carbon-monoxide dehydrogenase large subunit